MEEGIEYKSKYIVHNGDIDGEDLSGFALRLEPALPDQRSLLADIARYNHDLEDHIYEMKKQIETEALEDREEKDRLFRILYINSRVQENILKLIVFLLIVLIIVILFLR